MKTTLFTAINCLLVTACFAQADSSATVTDSSQLETTKTTLTLGALYNSNASYYGQTSKDKLPYILANATVRFPSGIYLTTSAYKLLDKTSSTVSAINAGAGMDIRTGKKTSIGLAFSHTFFPDNSPFLQIANASNAGASFTYNHWLTTTIGGDYAFGKQNDYFASLSNSKYIVLGSLAKGKDVISITPAIEITAGTQHFYETYITEKNYRDSLLGIIPIFPGGQETEQTTVTRKSTSFSLLSYKLAVPVAYSRSRYMIEAAYQVSVLANDAEAFTDKPMSFFTCSFYYQF
jgi:hypothetical protein